jgi:TonB family protein
MSATASTSSARAPAAAIGETSERIAFHGPTTPGEVNRLAVFTLVLWVVCSAICLFGLALPYARPRPPAPREQTIVQQLQVELTQDALPPPDAELPPPNPLAPPPPPDALTPPPITQPIAVAEPTAAIAFALPVEGPTRIVDPKRAEYARPSVTNTPAPVSSAPPAQPLTYGQGEGKQPAPDYPPQARREGQEGTVVVRLSVGENGRVVAAEAISPSPWPLLNEAALRAVRERWRFRSGPTRLYDVAIRFELSK